MSRVLLPLAVAGLCLASNSVALAKPAAPASPLDSFKAIVAKYTAFFSKEPLMYWSEPFSKSPTGKTYLTIKYAADDVSYDVRKTDSLVSPYTAYVATTHSMMENVACGDLKHDMPAALQAALAKRGMKGIFYGFSTAEASGAANQAECWQLAYGKKVDYQFNYAYQDGKWVFKGFTGKPEHMFSTFTEHSTYSDAGSDPRNKPWADFFESVTKMAG